ncbi:hypothetical protein H4S07_003526 [Coemansia furcata]|uniref:Uncharacterized protein n=1 Tax=Coemansia furcata TaxID=417177 RepID=A0ACC1LG25_9FUNG|nr:hypothetical protein H4S07_003526 [Coemansia furcata]
MNRPYQSQPHLATPTTTYVNGTGATSGPTLGYGSTPGFPTIHPNSHRRPHAKQHNSHHFTQSFVDRPSPIQAGPVQKAATASPDIGRAHGWAPAGNSNSAAGPQYNSYPSTRKQRHLRDYYNYQHQQPQQTHTGQHHQQQQQQQPQKQPQQQQQQMQQKQPQKQHLSYPLSKGEYRHGYQHGHKDHHGNSGYADRHGYMFDGQWNESPLDSPPELDFGYYLSQILQIPDMRDQQQQQQNYYRHHMQQPHSASAVDMPIPMSNMQRTHKRVTFANPLATIAEFEPVSLVDPVALLSCQPYKSALSKTLNQPPTYAGEYLGPSYAQDYDHCYDYGHDYGHDHHYDYSSSNVDGNGLAAYIEHKHRIQQQQQQTQCHTDSHCYEHTGNADRRRRDSANYAEENHASSSSKVRRRKTDCGPRMSAVDSLAKPHKQYRYDGRFSLSMEHLPLYNHNPPS